MILLQRSHLIKNKRAHRRWALPWIFVPSHSRRRPSLCSGVAAGGKTAFVSAVFGFEGSEERLRCLDARETTRPPPELKALDSFFPRRCALATAMFLRSLIFARASHAPPPPFGD